MSRFIYGLVFSWIDLVSSMISALCLGLYRPWWTIHFAAWYAKRHILNKENKT